QPDVEDDRIEPLVPRRLERLRCRSALDADELFVELELFCQRLAQRDVVVDNQDSATGLHNLPRGAASWLPCYPRKAISLIPTWGTYPIRIPRLLPAGARHTGRG